MKKSPHEASCAIYAMPRKQMLCGNCRIIRGEDTAWDWRRARWSVLFSAVDADLGVLDGGQVKVARGGSKQ